MERRRGVDQETTKELGKIITKDLKRQEKDRVRQYSDPIHHLVNKEI